MYYRLLLARTAIHLKGLEIGTQEYYEFLALCFAVRHDKVKKLIENSKRFDGVHYSTLNKKAQDSLADEFGICNYPICDDVLDEFIDEFDFKNVATERITIPFIMFTDAMSSDKAKSFILEYKEPKKFNEQLPSKILKCSLFSYGISLNSIDFEKYDLYNYENKSAYAIVDNEDKKQLKRVNRFIKEYIINIEWVKLSDPLLN